MKKTLLFLLLNMCGAFAQNPSDLDTSFNDIPIPANRHCLDYFAAAIETNSQGQMLILNGNTLSFVDSDQNLLHSFFFGYSILGFKFQDDQHAILFVENPVLNGVTASDVFRVSLSTGTVDPTFVLDPQVSFNNLSTGSIHIWNNKIYVKANSPQVNGIYKTILRLNMDGSLDNTFNFDGDSYLQAFYMPDGSVFMHTDSFTNLVRLNIDGTVDSNFADTIGYISITDVKAAPDGDYYFLGGFSINGVISDKKIVKVHPNGTIASGFTPIQDDYAINAMGIQDGKVVISGYQFGDWVIEALFLKRILADGTVDPTFENVDIEYQSQQTYKSISLSVLPNGKFYLSNLEQFRHNGTLLKKLVRFNSDGTLDQTFDRVCKGFTDGNVTVLAEQSDGKLLVAGAFNSYNSIDTPARLIRLLPDGSIDNAFQSNLGKQLYTEGGSSFTGIQVMPDGKILLAGGFLYENQDGTTSRTLLVLNPDGTTFKSYTNAIFNSYNSSFQINLQSNGRPLIYGRTAYLAGSTTNSNIIRLDENYNADPTFQPIYVTNSFDTRKFVVLPDDKLLVSGAYGVGNRFRKYNADGSPDSSFSTSIANYNFDVQNDGKIIIFTSAPSGSSFNYDFRRLSITGTLETTLYQTNMANELFLLQPDNKIIYVSQDNLLIRFSPSGVIDNTFEQKLFENGYYFPNVMKILSDGRIAIGGSDDIYDGQRIGKLAILKGDEAGLNVDHFNSGESISIYPNPVKDLFTIESVDLISQIGLFDLQGRLLETQIVNGQSVSFDLSPRASGLYFLKVTTSKGIETVKLVKE